MYKGYLDLFAIEEEVIDIYNFVNNFPKDISNL